MATATRKQKTKKRHRGVAAFEDVREFGGPVRHEVDTENKVIRGVKIIGLESPNGHENYPEVRRRIYTKEALIEAIPAYEGMAVNIDHTNNPKDTVRSVLERFGRLRNVRFVEGEGLFGDLEYLAKSPHADFVIEVAQRMPEQFGLSPHHFIDGEAKGDSFFVTKIGHVASVDVVYKPATTDGFFEHRERHKMKKHKLKSVLERLFWTPRCRRLIAAMEQEDLLDDPSGEPAMVEMPPVDEVSADEQAKAAFRAMIMSAVNDESLDMKDTLDRIKQILESQEKLLNGAGVKASEMDEEDEEEVVEARVEKRGDGFAVVHDTNGKVLATSSTREGANKKRDDILKRNLPKSRLPARLQEMDEGDEDEKDKKISELQEQLRMRDRKEKYLAICEQVGVKPTAEVLETLVQIKDERRAKIVIESLKPSVGAKEFPASVPPRGAAAQEMATVPAGTAEETANWLRN